MRAWYCMAGEVIEIDEDDEYAIHSKKKLVVDERGQPQEVIISWEQYQQIIEILGLDLDDAAIANLREARRDRIAEKRDAYVALNPAR